MEGQYLKYSYQFQLDNGENLHYQFEVDPETLTLVEKDEAPPAGPWTALEFHQCPHCPLSKEEFPQCPLAKAISDMTIHFKDTISFEPAKMLIHVTQRSYYKKGPIQEGLSSLFGLLSAFSKCPHLDFLKPMARYHLPFADDKETSWRSLGLYLCVQYFRHVDKKSPDWDLEELKKLYDNLSIVNEYMMKRIRNVAKKDAGKNAYTLLSLYSQSLSLKIENQLGDLREMFWPSGLLEK